FTVDSTAPATASVTAPVDGTFYTASAVPATFTGSAADNAGGLGLNSNSTTFTLQRATDGYYWTGTTWQAAVVNLATPNNPTTSTTITVSDSAGNTYTKNADQIGGSGTSGIRTLVFSAPVTTALSNGTITVASTASVNIAATFFTFNGLVSPAPVDKVATATGTTATTVSSASTAATSLPDELLIGAMAIEGKAGGGWTSFSAGSGFTALTASANSGNPSNYVTMQPEYKIASATGAYAATGTLTAAATRWAAAIATYKIVVPTVSSINRAAGAANPTTGPADFTVTFSDAVTGVNSADFVVTTVTGSATASVSSVTQVNTSTYTVTV